MTTTLAVTFDLGRYHATPWGANVNEGAVELPPSPWRLLRALYAVWRTRATQLDDADVHGLLTALASVDPTYTVPPHTIAHTRHYYPDSTSRRGATSTDRTLDAFAAISPTDLLYITWPIQLLLEQHSTMETLAKHLPYLGRADSIATAALLTTPVDHPPGYTIWRPASDPEAPIATRLLAPQDPLDLNALTQRPVDWRTRKLLYPVSTRHVAYTIDQYTSASDVTPFAPTGRTRPMNARNTVVRLMLGEPIRPPCTDLLPLTDLLHRVSAQKLDTVRAGSRANSNLLGKDTHGAPLTGHQHTHYLCRPDQYRRIREIILWTPAGLDDDELTALMDITTLREGTPSPRLPRGIRLLVSAHGGTELLPNLWTGPAHRWRSLTPYLPTGHPKGDSRMFAAKRLQRDLTNLDPDLAAQLTAVEPIPNPYGIFDRRRNADRTNRRPEPPAHQLQLTFRTPITGPTGGPLLLGQLSHFGFGHFLPEPDSDS